MPRLKQVWGLQLIFAIGLNKEKDHCSKHTVPGGNEAIEMLEPHWNVPTAEWKSFEENSSILDLASYAIGWRHFPTIKSFWTLNSFECTVRRRPLASKSKTQKFKPPPPTFKVNYCISICNTESCIRNRWLMYSRTGLATCRGTSRCFDW